MLSLLFISGLLLGATIYGWIMKISANAVLKENTRLKELVETAYDDGWADAYKRVYNDIVKSMTTPNEESKLICRTPKPTTYTLDEQLQKAIQNEDFERAAELREELKKGEQ